MASTLKSNLNVSPQDIFSQSSTQLTDIGAYATTGDSRGFRYSLVGAVSTVVGKLYQASAQDTTNLNPAGGLGVAAAAVGATSVTLTDSLTLTANQVQGGFMAIAVTPGVGYVYKIKSNTAVSGAANCVVTLEDSIQVALTTSSKAVMTPNPYNGIIVNPATASSAPVGVAQYVITNAYYGWIQTHGPAALLNDSATAVGLGIAPSAAVAGASKTMAATAANIGYALQAGVNTQYNFVFLTID